MLTAHKNTLSEKIAFIFGVRNRKDSFYTDEIRVLQKTHPSLTYVQYFSQEESLEAANECMGYVTDWITPEHIGSYQEFYICGSPAMVKDARNRLTELNVSEKCIFFEQY